MPGVESMHGNIYERDEAHACKDQKDIARDVAFVQQEAPEEEEVEIDQRHIRRQERPQLPIETRVDDMVDAEGDQRGENIVGQPKEGMVDPGAG